MSGPRLLIGKEQDPARLQDLLTTVVELGISSRKELHAALSAA